MARLSLCLALVLSMLAAASAQQQSIEALVEQQISEEELTSEHGRSLLAISWGKLPIAKAGGRCGANIAKCPKKYCCSNEGRCSKSATACDVAKGCKVCYGDCKNYYSSGFYCASRLRVAASGKQCGPAVKQRCGSKFQCCGGSSTRPTCGSSTAHCTRSCNKLYGMCRFATTTPKPPSPKPQSPKRSPPPSPKRSPPPSPKRSPPPSPKNSPPPSPKRSPPPSPPPPSFSGRDAQPPPSSSNPGIEPGVVYTGDLTYYTGGWQSACGIKFADAGNNYAAIPGVMSAAFDTFKGSKWPMSWCGTNGARLNVTGPKGWAIAYAIDYCPECAWGSLDSTQDVFMKVVGDLAVGRQHGIKWYFL